MVWCTLILSYLWKPTTAVGSPEEISLESNTASQPSMGKRTMPLCHSPTAPWKCTLFSDTMLNLPGHWIRARCQLALVCLEVRLLFRLLPTKHQITRCTDALNARCARVCLRCLPSMSAFYCNSNQLPLLYFLVKVRASEESMPMFEFFLCRLTICQQFATLQQVFNRTCSDQV